MSDDDTDDITR